MIGMIARNVIGLGSHNGTLLANLNGYIGLTLTIYVHTGHLKELHALNAIIKI
jgi:hypothetical protein